MVVRPPPVARSNLGAIGRTRTACVVGAGVDLLAQYVEFTTPVTKEVVEAAANYSVIGATIGIFMAMLARYTGAPGEIAYGEWGSVGGAAAAAVVVVTQAL
jgi:hypothetical protein